MTTLTTETGRFDARGHGRKVLILLAMVLAGATAMLWGWNTIAVDLAGLPRAEFRHGLSAMIAIAFIAGIFRLVTKD